MQQKKKVVATVLTAAMALQSVSVPAVAYDGTADWFAGGQKTVQAQSVEQSSQILLQNGSAFIPKDAESTEIKQILFDALVANRDGVDAQSLEWEFYGTGKSVIGQIKSAWGDVLTGHEWKEGWTTYRFSPLKDQKPGEYRVRIKGTNAEIKLTLTAKQQSQIMLKQNSRVSLFYGEDEKVDYQELYKTVYQELVEGTTPELGLQDLSITYHATATTGAVGSIGTAWVPLEGGKQGGLTYPAISAGTQEIKVSYQGNRYYNGAEATAKVEILDREEAPYQVNDPIGTVKLAVNEDLSRNDEAIYNAVFDAVIASSDVIQKGDKTTIEYEATGALNTHVWVPLQGGKVNGISYPAVPEGTQKVRIIWNGNRQYAKTVINATVPFADRNRVIFTEKNPGTAYDVAMPFQEDENGNPVFDYPGAAERIYNAVVDSAVVDLENDTQHVLAFEDMTVMYNTDTSGMTDSFKPLDQKGLANLVAFGLGEWEIRISCKDTQAYRGNHIDVRVNMKDREEAPYQVNDPIGTVKLAVNEDLSRNDEAIYNAVFDAVIASSDVIQKGDKTTIEYEATGALNTHVWVPLQGGKVNGISYPAVPEGTQKVRILWNGNLQYRPTVIQANVPFAERPQMMITEKNPGNLYEAGMYYLDDQSFDYAKTEAELYRTVVESVRAELEDGTEASLSYEDMTVLYNTDVTGLTDSFKPLNQKGLTPFGLGEWEIRISCNDTQAYRGNHIDVKVNMVDSRVESRVVLKEGQSFKYNMNPEVMKQHLFDQVIDWDQSALPNRDQLSLADFVLEYKGDSQLSANAPENWKPVKGWAPIEGGQGSELSNKLLQYPKMGAGNQQEVRIRFKGNGEYRPSQAGTGLVDVLKAKVRVRVGMRNIYVGEEVPSYLVNLNPKDPTIDVYTIYTGTTSDFTPAVYLELPDKYTNNTVVLKLLDPVAKQIIGKSFTEILNEGVTLGQLRDLFSSELFLDLLDRMQMDTDAIRKVLSVLNRMPNVTDQIQVAFGAPVNNAGLYTVTAVTDSKNYETAVGIGSLLVKKHLVGTKITWNQEIGKTLTVEEAKQTDFSATLSHNGDITVEQNLHYLYSGFSKKGRPYSSTTKAPTDPGRYVMTVVTLGGNYTAAPLTRSFRIVE